MKTFLDEDFLLHSDSARKLYHDYAEDLPIIDYHCHLPPEQIAEDHQFENITRAWLYGDHYKWRAMRANGVDEKYITGDAGDREKFLKWAETVPYTLRNPLYHWTHLELKRYFDIHELLNPGTAKNIYDKSSNLISGKDYSVKALLEKMNVEVICTTDDPANDLEHHKQLRKEKYKIKVFPAWRADKAMAAEDPRGYNQYLDKLEGSAGKEIRNYYDLLEALQKRHDYFAEQGCRLSDHGLEEFYAEDYSDHQINQIFARVRQGKRIEDHQIRLLKSSVLYHLAVMDHDKGWTQQFHIGALRNNNTKMFRRLGPDTGFDSIGDFNLVRNMSKFFNRLEMENKLTRTIVYNLNPTDNEVFVTMLYNFNDGSVPGKMQLGSGWWFLDQKDGIEKQLNALSNMGLLSRFVGMLTDSRSFLSFPRHEYFRRVLCNLVGEDVENGEIPNDKDMLKSLIQGICYYNGKEYFGFHED